MSVVGDWLQRELRDRRIKQSEIERRTGIPASNLSKQIADVRELRVSELLQVFEVLGYPDPLEPVRAEEAEAMSLFRTLDAEHRNAVMALLKALPRSSTGINGNRGESASTMAK